MLIVDSHVHLYPPEVNAAPEAWASARGERHWAVLCTRRRKNGSPVQGFPGVDSLLRDMDDAGIGRVVLQGWYWEKHDTCRRQNRFYADCVRAHPDRLSAFASLHPAAGATAASDELRWAADHGFSGLGELSPHSQNVAPSDPVWREILAQAGERGMLVNLHVTEPAGRGYPGRVQTPLEDFLRLAQAFPATRFILAHWGARLPLHPGVGEAARACPNLWYDTAASPLLYGPEVYREMLGAVGVGRLLYGSDHPLDVYPRKDDDPKLGAMLADVRSAGLTPDETASLLGGNAADLLGLTGGE